MPDFINTFINGRMDSDTNYALVDNKSYVRAENLRISGDGDDGSFKNLKGSRLVSQQFSEEGMKCLREFDGLENKMYYFLAHPNGKSKIVEYDTETEVTKLIIQDTQHLRFDLIRWNNNVEIVPQKFLLSVDQIGDVLFFSDSVWEYPRAINVKRDYSGGITLDDIVLAKKPPAKAPEMIVKEKLTSISDKEISNVFISFSYRYKYNDNNYSSLSFYSDVAFDPVTTGAKINNEKLNEGMVNIYNSITLRINSGGKNVTDIEVYAREHNSNTAYRIYSVNKAKSGIADNVSIENIKYQFSKNYPILNEEDTKLLYSNIPKNPKTQTSVGNYIFYGGYWEGYNLDFQGNVDFVARKKFVPLNVSTSKQSIASMTKAKVCMIYYDEYNYSTTALLPVSEEKAELDIDFADRLVRNQIEVIVNNAPPSFAKKVKFGVKSDELNYDILHITTLKKIGSKVYLLLTGDNVNRVQKDDTLIRVDVGMSEKYEYVVSEVKLFDIKDGLKYKGLYAVIEVGSEFIIDTNGLADVDKDYNTGTHTLPKNATNNNPTRFISVGASTSQERWWNIAWVKKADIGQIKEGDIVKLAIGLAYIVLSAGSSLQETISFTKEMYASSNYTNPYDFFVSEFNNPYLNIEQDSEKIYFRTNSEYPQYVQETAPNIYGATDENSSVGFQLLVAGIANLDIQRGVKPQIFRTKNKETLNENYFETYKTYDIVNGQYVPDYFENGKPIFNIGFYNSYNLGNGFESYKIKDAFNGKKLSNKFRGTLYELNGYKKIHRKYDITFGGVYNHELQINKTSVFNPTLANWKTLPIKYGGINYIVGTSGNLSVYFENGIGFVMYGKSIIYDLSSNENLATSKEVLGDFIEVSDYFGCNEPESIVKTNDGNYLVDKKRSRFLLHQDRNIIEINAPLSGFLAEGVDILKKGKSFLGAYDEAHGEYVVGVDLNYSIAFSLRNKGFTTYYRNKFDYISSVNGNLFTAYNGKIYQNEYTDSRSNFSGQGVFTSKIVFVVNSEMQSDKIFKALALQSNVAWDVRIKTNLCETFIPETSFTKKESFFYSEIFRDTTGTHTSVGIGNIKEIIGNILVFNFPVSSSISVGDYLVGGVYSQEYEIVDIDENKVYVLDSSGLSVGDYAYTIKNYLGNFRPNGTPIRGKYMEVTLEKTTTEPIEITSVTTNLIKSFL